MEHFRWNTPIASILLHKNLLMQLFPGSSRNGRWMEVLCTIGSSLSSRTQELRSSENAFGCLVADAMLSACECDGALINGGFIRQDRLYAANLCLTVQQVKVEMPFSTQPAVIRLTGAALLRGLEESVALCPTPASCFPHLSEGMTLKFDIHAPPLKRICRGYDANKRDRSDSRCHMVCH
ncbi:unnamed protein product [Durusdinium trenchii]|uniref:5'-Nucleotidase C-terminal domain-containing protein n=1 Tax=Durusdinium trenchii TaxID=1381693 RepID=A0ABP0I801_9DINO